MLTYQFVGNSDGLHRIPEHIQRIQKKLGIDDRERALVEDLLPGIYKRNRASSIPEKAVPRTIQIATLSKRISEMKHELSKIDQLLTRHQNHRANVRSPKTQFEMHFNQIATHIAQLEEERENLHNQIKSLKKEMFLLETQNETYTSKKQPSNQSVKLSELVEIERRYIQYLNRNPVKNQKLPKIQNVSEFQLPTHQDASNLVDYLETDEDIRPKTRQLPTLDQIVEQLDMIISKPNDVLMSSQNILYNFRRAKYDKYIFPQKRITGRRTLRSCVAVVVFCIWLMKATGISQQRYLIISKQYHKQYYQKCQQECLFFVNNIVGKEILFKISRLQQLQKQDKKSLKSLNPITATEIVKEIIQKLMMQRFSKTFNNFIQSISQSGYYPLSNYHCEAVRQKMYISRWGYITHSCRKLVAYEFIILKSIIFYGLFCRAQQLFQQLKIDLDHELIETVAIIFFELFLRHHNQSVFNTNIKIFANPTIDGIQMSQQLKDIDQIKEKLINYVQFEDLQKSFNQMIDKL